MEEHDEKNSGNYLYLACTKYDTKIYLKIGFTNNIKERMRKIVTNSPIPLRVVFYTYKEWDRETKALEKILHYFLKEYRIHHEWFTPRKELFIELEELMNRFKGKISWEDSYDLLEKIEEEIPSLNEYSEEAHDLIVHFSEIEWKSIRFDWRDKKYTFQDISINKGYLEMLKLLESLT